MMISIMRIIHICYHMFQYVSNMFHYASKNQSYLQEGTETKPEVRHKFGQPALCSQIKNDGEAARGQVTDYRGKEGFE